MRVMFEPDEQVFHTRVGLPLPSVGYAYFKDVARCLKMPGEVLLREVRRNNREEMFQKTGLCQIFGHWMVRLKMFTRYLHEKPYLGRIREVEPDWDGNDLLQQEGYFYLSSVIALLPLNIRQVRYHLLRGNLPVRYAKHHNQYLVEMGSFAAWIKHIWFTEEW
jgi:hypothetical protein